MAYSHFFLNSFNNNILNLHYCAKYVYFPELVVLSEDQKILMFFFLYLKIYYPHKYFTAIIFLIVRKINKKLYLQWICFDFMICNWYLKKVLRESYHRMIHYFPHFLYSQFCLWVCECFINTISINDDRSMSWNVKENKEFINWTIVTLAR